MATIPTPLQQRLAAVRARIAQACESATRPADSVRLLAVSKTFPAAAVQEAADAGQAEFGENYVQEAVEKIAALRHMTTSTLVWHFIGPIQSNKTRPIAENFDWVHSIDRDRIARRLSEQRPSELLPLQICLQVNISAEASKSGLMPAEVLEVALAVAALLAEDCRAGCRPSQRTQPAMQH